VVPESGVKKNQTSIALAVVVRVIVPPGLLNVPPENATVLPGVASFVRTRTNDDTAPGFETVRVALPFKVAVNSVPRERSIVAAVSVLPIATAVSTTFFVVSVVVEVIAAADNVPVNVGLALNTKLPVPVSSDITAASSADVVAANCLKLPPFNSLIALTTFALVVVVRLVRTPIFELVVVKLVVCVLILVSAVVRRVLEVALLVTNSLTAITMLLLLVVVRDDRTPILELTTSPNVFRLEKLLSTSKFVKGDPFTVLKISEAAIFYLVLSRLIPLLLVILLFIVN